MEELKAENKGIGAIKEFDFWKDATEFVKTLVVPDIENRIAEHMNERGFNDNEMRLCREYMLKAFDMYTLFSYLKNHVK